MGVFQPVPLKEWLAADLDHRIIAALGLFLLLALFAAHDSEKDLDGLSTLLVEPKLISARVWSTFKHSDLNDGRVKGGILDVHFWVRFLNNSGTRYRAFFQDDPYRFLVVLPFEEVRSARLLDKNFDPKELSGEEPEAEAQESLELEDPHP